MGKSVKVSGDKRKINNYDYVRMFPDLFLDIKECDDDEKTLKSIIMMPRQLYATFILRFGELINEMSYDEDGVFSDMEKYVRNTVILLIRKIIEILDAMTVLTENSIFVPNFILFRSYVETVVTLCFIIKSDDGMDINLKAAAYYLQRKYEEKELFEKTQHEFENGNSVIDHKTFIIAKEAMTKKINALSTMINKNTYFNEVDNRRKTLKRKSPKWYEIFKINDFRKLMEHVNMGMYYDGIYKTTSIDVHSVGASNDMDIDIDTMTGKPKYIRSPEGMSVIVELIADFSYEALKALYSFLGDTGEVLFDDDVFFLDFFEKKQIISENLSKLRIERKWTEIHSK